MKKKTNQQQQLQISSFIKDPASLKLLILAGTNIKPTELTTISKCTGLIKLDLSSNFLEELPLKFSNFPQMKILYLHDNQLTHVEIRGTQIQYISLFKNIIQPTEYRKTLINNNDKLLGIDFNIITQKQRYRQHCDSLPVFSEIKWPIVQISSSLEHEDDYLNLLKAEIFVISNVHKRTVKIQRIQRIFQGYIRAKKYIHLRKQNLLNVPLPPSVIKAAQKWKQFVQLKKKLRAILAKKKKQHLILNRMQRKKLQRSEQLNRIVDDYMKIVRVKMRVREPFERNLKEFRRFIPALKGLYNNYLDFKQERNYKTNPAILYFRCSQLDILSKVCLYAKKLFFKEKDYDLCDQFNNLFKETGKKFIIYRKNNELYDIRSWMMNNIHDTAGYILREEGIDRKYFLYAKFGHKKIRIKNINKLFKINEEQKSRVIQINKRLQFVQDKYDRLMEYKVCNWKILRTILKIIRFINSGNGHSIVSTETAYFQTEVILDEQNTKQTKIRIHLSLQFFAKRVIAANVIQKFWRKKMSQKKNMNIVQILKYKRAQALVSRWARNLIFRHRLASIKYRSYLACMWKQSQVYIHLEIYMNLPKPTNFLRFPYNPQSSNDFYSALHKGTQVQITQTQGRKWVKITYPTVQQALNAQILFHKSTYCFYEGFHLRLFTGMQLKDTKSLLKYEKNIQHLFKIKITPSDNQQTFNLKTTLNIENTQPYFIWSQVHALQHANKFENQQKYHSNVSIFIYNKHKRPLKVSCEFYWVSPPSIYTNKKPKPIVRQKPSYSEHQIPHNEMEKVKFFRESMTQNSLNILQIEYNMKKNSKKGRHYLDLPRRLDLRQIARANSLGSRTVSLTKNHRTRKISESKLQKLSETLNIRGK